MAADVATWALDVSASAVFDQSIRGSRIHLFYPSNNNRA